MTTLRRRPVVPLAAAILVLGLPRLAAAQGELNAGDTAWMLTSSVLVLFMTIPGLSLFYAGLVRAKNVLSVMMQCFAITCMVTVLWTVYAYGLAFGDGGSLNGFIGFGKFFSRTLRWAPSRAPYPNRSSRCSSSRSPLLRQHLWLGPSRSV